MLELGCCVGIDDGEIVGVLLGWELELGCCVGVDVGELVG